MTEIDWGYGNIYSAPEKAELEIFGEAEDEDASYSFDLFVVWRDKDGRLYWAEDSGCSCPSPFEDGKSISFLTPATVAEIHAALDKWAGDSRYRKVNASAAELHAKLAAL